MHQSKRAAGTLAVALWITLAGAPALAQSPESTARDSGLREDVRVRLVQLNVLATDKDGHPITDLGPGDLSITYDGVDQVAAFVNGPGAARSSTVTPAPGATATTPDTAPAAPHRTIVLFFENFISSPRTRRDALAAARRFIEEDVAPTDRVSVVAFNGQVNVVQTFTHDKDALLSACERSIKYERRASQPRSVALRELVDQLEFCSERYAVTAAPGSRISPAPAGPDDRRSGCVRAIADLWRTDNERSIDAYLTALTGLVRALAPVPETKVLVLFSDGLPRDAGAEAESATAIVFKAQGTVYLQGRSKLVYEDRALARLAEAAAHARVSIFGVYPAGVARNTGVDVTAVEPAGGFDQLGGIDLGHVSELNMRDGLEEVARRTGGSVSLAPDAFVGLRQVVDVSRGLYVVGFYPRGEKEAGQHSVVIKAVRKGLHLQYGKDLERPVSAGRLRGDMALQPGACNSEGTRELSIRLSLERRSLTFEKVAGNFAANFSLYLSVLRDGQTEPDFTEYRFFNITNTPQEYEGSGLTDPALEQKLMVPCAGLTLTYTVTDSATGATATFSTRSEP